jgi:hypothetical protein
VGAGNIRTDFTNNATLSLGAMGVNGFPFRGNMDDMRVYTRALSAAEIAAIINAVNIPPVIGSVTNRSLAVSASTGAIGFSVSDAETAPQHLALSASSSNTGLVQNTGIALSGGGTNRTVTVTTLSNRLGVATITLTVNDGTRVTLEDFTLAVTGSAAETWRFDRFGTTANSGSAADGANPDGDAWSNAVEYVLGTDPLTPNAGLTLDSAAAVSGGLQVTFYARQAAGLGYAGLTRYFDVESAIALSGASWSSVAGRTGIVGSNQTVTVTLPLDGPRRFYQVKARLQE